LTGYAATKKRPTGLRALVFRLAAYEINGLSQAALSSSIQTLTVGIGVSPILRRSVRGLYRRSGISPCPEDIIHISFPLL